MTTDSNSQEPGVQSFATGHRDLGAGTQQGKLLYDLFSKALATQVGLKIRPPVQDVPCKEQKGEKEGQIDPGKDQ